jgi:hypothetical protein
MLGVAYISSTRPAPLLETNLALGANEEPTPIIQVPAKRFQKLVKADPVIEQTSALRSTGAEVVGM